MVPTTPYHTHLVHRHHLCLLCSTDRKKIELRLLRTTISLGFPILGFWHLQAIETNLQQMCPRFIPKLLNETSISCQHHSFLQLFHYPNDFFLFKSHRKSFFLKPLCNWDPRTPMNAFKLDLKNLFLHFEEFRTHDFVEIATPAWTSNNHNNRLAM